MTGQDEDEEGDSGDHDEDDDDEADSDLEEDDEGGERLGCVFGSSALLCLENTIRDCVLFSASPVEGDCTLLNPALLYSMWNCGRVSR